MTQANSMASGLKESLSIPPFITGAVVTLVVAAVILGGVKRIAAVTEKWFHLWHCFIWQAECSCSFISVRKFREQYA